VKFGNDVYFLVSFRNEFPVSKRNYDAGIVPDRVVNDDYRFDQWNPANALTRAAISILSEIPSR
jgi:hypothetical protein